MNKSIKSSVLISTILTNIATPTNSNADSDFIKLTIEDVSEKTVQSDDEVVELSFVNTSLSDVDIVLRIGEYPDKPGKRLILNSKSNSYNNLPVKYDKYNNNYYICEHYFNEHIATKLYAYLKNKGINIILQDTENKSQDLNAAGRIAKKSNPKIYLSIHTNAYSDSSSGYLFLTNNDELSNNVAKRLSNSIRGNGLIPQSTNQINTGYIGELNQKPGTINILAELGFFSNPEEAKKLSSDEYADYVAKHMGDELIKILKELN